jgi:hypothetical protein
VDATAIALVSVVVTGVTAIAVPFISAKAGQVKEEQHFRHERLIRDFDELRTLLDEVAESIARYIEAVGALESSHSTARSTDVDQFGEQMLRFREVRETMLQFKARLVIRLGRMHGVVAAFQHAFGLIDGAGMEVLAMITLEQPASPDALQLRPPERRKWFAAYEQYLDAASDLVGSPIEPLKKAD